MRPFLAIFILFAACGTEVPNSIYLDDGGYDISEEMVGFVIDEVEYQFSRYYGRPDIRRLANKVGLSIYYSQEEPEEYRGIYYYDGNKIEIRPGQIENPVDFCVEKYYVLGHELMHFLAENYLHLVGVGHDVPNVFLSWAYHNDLSFEETAELYVYVNIRSRCEAHCSVRL